jgi:hypothetical protein
MISADNGYISRSIESNPQIQSLRKISSPAESVGDSEFDGPQGVRKVSGIIKPMHLSTPGGFR